MLMSYFYCVQENQQMLSNSDRRLYSFYPPKQHFQWYRRLKSLLNVTSLGAILEHQKFGNMATKTNLPTDTTYLQVDRCHLNQKTTFKNTSEFRSQFPQMKAMQLKV